MIEGNDFDLSRLQLFSQEVLVPTLKSYGFNTTKCKVEDIKMDPHSGRSRENVSKQLSEKYDKWTNDGDTSSSSPLVLIVLPSIKKDIPLYSDIKWWSDCVVEYQPHA